MAHGEQVERWGEEASDLALVLLHGRARPVEELLDWVRAHVDLAGARCVAPVAEARSWYPGSFLRPWQDNQPALGEALACVHDCVEGLVADGIPARRVLLVGFSQGACLATTYAATHPRHYGGVAAFTGGLIGPRERWSYAGSLDETPVYLGCSDPDDWVPFDQVEASAHHLGRMQARVELERLADAPHALLPAHARALNAMLEHRRTT